MVIAGNVIRMAEPSPPSPPDSALIVDDEEAIRLLLTTALRASGTPDIVACESGEDAVKVLDERGFDVLITDKNLPGIDGHQVIDVARAKHPNIAVIMITAAGTLESSTRGFRQRIDYYLLKPFD